MEKNTTKFSESEFEMLDFHPIPLTDLEFYIFEQIPRIASTMGLEELNYYYRTVPDNVDITSGGQKASGAVLAMEFKKEYKAFYLTVCPEATRYFKEGKKHLILRALVHELCHLITDELASHAQNRYVSKKLVQGSVEETTEKIAMLVRKLLSNIDPEAFSF